MRRYSRVQDHFYSLDPEEDLCEVDGHLLILLLGEGEEEGSLEEHVTKKVTRLGDSSEFVIALVEASHFPHLLAGRSTPSLLHYVDGRYVSGATGMDPCLDFFQEFVANNRR